MLCGGRRFIIGRFGHLEEQRVRPIDSHLPCQIPDASKIVQRRLSCTSLPAAHRRLVYPQNGPELLLTHPEYRFSNVKKIVHDAM